MVSWSEGRHHSRKVIALYTSKGLVQCSDRCDQLGTALVTASLAAIASVSVEGSKVLLIAPGPLYSRWTHCENKGVQY